MTKTARLFFIIDLLRGGRTFSVSELASLCKISQRTVFRDIRDLQALQLPITYDDGYRLESRKKSARTLIDREEFDILRFALKSNPLAGIFGFDRKLKSLETKLRNLCDSPRELGGSADGRRASCLRVERPGRRSVGAREARMIALLWKRSLEGRRVYLTIKSTSARKTQSLSGKAERLIWKDERWSLSFRRSRSSRLLTLYINQITSIQLASDQADS